MSKSDVTGAATPEWLSTEEAVEYLRFPSRDALYQAVQRGQVPAYRLGSRRLRFRTCRPGSLFEELQDRSPRFDGRLPSGVCRRGRFPTMVKVRKYRRRGKPTGCWEADVRLELPSGEFYRERIRTDLTGRSGALRWANAREVEVLRLAGQGLDVAAIRARLNGTEVEEEAKVPTLAEFQESFIGHAKANRQKASTVYAKESMLRVHLIPTLGTKRLDEITEADVQVLKVSLAERKPKTVNNVLNCLSKLLKVAKKLGDIDEMPIDSVELLKVAPPTVQFYTFEEYVALVAAAERPRPAPPRRRPPGRRRWPTGRRGFRP